MTFHVVSLPHTQTTAEYLSCAYTQKVIKFCKMMKDLGHKVYLYSGEENEAECDEHIPCIPKAIQQEVIAGKHYTQASFDWNLDHWQKFNLCVALHIKERIQPKDFICVIAGLAQKPIADVFPEHMTVEFGIGYGGTFSKYRVFESYAWMHVVLGAQEGAHSSVGHWYDRVIPNYFDINDFPIEEVKDDNYLYIGRITPDKGYQIAIDVCQKMKKKLILAGPGDPGILPSGVHYVGEVGKEKRGELMSRAMAVFTPSLYLEPFGATAVEAQLCGTPVITTDWGAFIETVKQKEAGRRCHTFRDFCHAVEAAERGEFDSKKIRLKAQDKWGMKRIGKKYEKYFKELLQLWDKGWYT